MNSLLNLLRMKLIFKMFKFIYRKGLSAILNRDMKSYKTANNKRLTTYGNNISYRSNDS